MSATVTLAPDREAKGDVARPPSHIENALSCAGAYAGNESVLQQAVRTARHQVVHYIVALRHPFEHAAHAGGLLFRGNILEAVGYCVGHGDSA